jgi:ribosome-associated protein
MRNILASSSSGPHATLRAGNDGDHGLNSSLQLANRIASVAAEKLATDIVILDMRDVVSYTDYFVIASGRTQRQTQAIAEEVRERLKRDGRHIPRHSDGERQGDWILMDYLDVVVHIFTPEARGFYRLESLWGEVPSEAFAG